MARVLLRNSGSENSETEFGMLRLLFIDSLCYKGAYLHSVGVFTYLGSAMALRTPFKVTACDVNCTFDYEPVLHRRTARGRRANPNNSGDRNSLIQSISSEILAIKLAISHNFSQICQQLQMRSFWKVVRSLATSHCEQQSTCGS